jgi:hypothetical protein
MGAILFAADRGTAAAVSTDLGRVLPGRCGARMGAAVSRTDVDGGAKPRHDVEKSPVPNKGLNRTALELDTPSKSCLRLTSSPDPS